MARHDNEQRIDELARAGMGPFSVAKINGGKGGIVVVYPPIEAKGGTLEMQPGSGEYFFYGPDNRFVGYGQLEVIARENIDKFNESVAVAKQKYSTTDS